MIEYIVHGGELKGRIEGIQCLQRAEALAYEHGAEVWEITRIDGRVKTRRIAIMRRL